MSVSACRLPDPLIRHTLGFLHVQDLGRCLGVSKQWSTKGETLLAILIAQPFFKSLVDFLKSSANEEAVKLEGPESVLLHQTSKGRIFRQPYSWGPGLISIFNRGEKRLIQCAPHITVSHLTDAVCYYSMAVLGGRIRYQRLLYVAQFEKESSKVQGISNVRALFPKEGIAIEDGGLLREFVDNKVSPEAIKLLTSPEDSMGSTCVLKNYLFIHRLFLPVISGARGGTLDESAAKIFFELRSLKNLKSPEKILELPYVAYKQFTVRANQTKVIVYTRMESGERQLTQYAVPDLLPVECALPVEEAADGKSTADEKSTQAKAATDEELTVNDRWALVKSQAGVYIVDLISNKFKGKLPNFENLKLISHDRLLTSNPKEGIVKVWDLHSLTSVLQRKIGPFDHGIITDTEIVNVRKTGTSATISSLPFPV